MKYFPILLIFLVRIAVANPNYTYPELLLNKPPTCTPIENKLNALIKVHSSGDPAHGERGNARFKLALDLNNDGNCEVFVLPAAYLAGNVPLWQSIWTLKNDAYVSIGQVPQSFPNSYRAGFAAEGFWFGKMKNEYPRIFVRHNAGHKTNPVFVTSVLAFNGDKYEYEFRSKFSYGRYRELGLEAYKDKKYKSAEKWYLNAYRMEGEKNIDDANNLALVYVKQGKCGKASDLLNKHLVDDHFKNARSINSAKHNLKLCNK